MRIADVGARPVAPGAGCDPWSAWWTPRAPGSAGGVDGADEAAARRAAGLAVAAGSGRCVLPDQGHRRRGGALGDPIRHASRRRWRSSSSAPSDSVVAGAVPRGSAVVAVEPRAR